MYLNVAVCVRYNNMLQKKVAADANNQKFTNIVIDSLIKRLNDR